MRNISHRYVRKWRKHYHLEERVKGDEYVLKKANQTNLKEEEKKGTTVKVDIKEDATSEEWYTLHIVKRKKYRINNKFF